jgi:epoxyqueuosine reductase
MGQDLETRSKKIKSMALDLGFTSCGISHAEFLEDEAPRLASWLKKNSHGKMSYMENHFDMRLDPRLLVPGAKSVISLLFNYHNPVKPSDPEAPRISSYALGEDYHYVIKDKLKELVRMIKLEIGEVEGRVFVDSAPVLDKAWAAKSGLGWIGKHSNLITKTQGSFFFIAELILDLDLIADTPINDYCGTCTKCIDACPTDAIVASYEVDGSKCISYFTIELKDALLPKGMSQQFENWMFGCDICQDVCPWNRFSLKHNEPKFEPKQELLDMSKNDWIDLTEETFSEIFRRSPVKRTGYEGLKRNVKHLFD